MSGILPYTDFSLVAGAAGTGVTPAAGKRVGGCAISEVTPAFCGGGRAVPVVGAGAATGKATGFTSFVVACAISEPGIG